ncbi:MAG: molybdopterin molybdotransferase MoeA [Tepidisphaeraceae bacterium]
MSELPTEQLLSVDEAIQIIDAAEVTVRDEAVALSQADGRVLAEEIRADRDYPPFDKSLMDGFAVRAADVVMPGVRLRSIGESSAGRPAAAALGPGECVAIMTGAPLPAGADAVVPIERVTIEGDEVRINVPISSGQSVSRRGSEARAGDPLLRVGRILGPVQLGVCAQVGKAEVRVAVRPRVGVLSSGNEIVDYATTPTGAEIRNSNSPMLMSLVRRFACEAVDLGHVSDDTEQIARAIQESRVDIVLITGGMSMGAYDYTPGVLRDLGYTLKIQKVKIKPGKPFVMAMRDAAPRFVFGLPGNPVSAFVCTVRFVARLFRRMEAKQAEPRWISATLAAALPRNGPRETYLPIVFTWGDAHPLALNSSGDLFTLARANTLIRRQADADPLPAGSSVRLLEIE